MQTLKTAVVVVLLIAVCYGAFIALNAPDDDIPLGIQEWANGEALDSLGTVEFPGAVEIDTSNASAMTAGDWSTSTPSLPQPGSLPNQTAGGTEIPQLDVGHLPELPSLDTPSVPDSTGFASVPELPTLPEIGAGGASAVASSTNAPVAGTPSGASGAIGTPGSLISVNLDAAGTQPAVAAEPTLDLPVPDLPGHPGASGDGVTAPATLPLASEASPSTASESANQPSTPPIPDMPFSIAREQALAKAKAGELKLALEMLSPYYDAPELDSAEHADLVNILDALSREVIYSTRHLYQPAYEVLATDTLTSVADAHRVTPDLLAAINGLGASKALLARAKLKVISGPFHARISLSRREMTLFLGNLYAGRFPVAIGADGPPVEGSYNVVDRRTDRTYYGPGGVVIQANEPENPYGGYWLSLGNNLSIHGSPEMARSDLANAGCISLAPLDAADAYMILTKDSRVEIRR